MIRLPAHLVGGVRSAFDGRRVCVTGGAGFIGGHLVDALLALGASVRVIDDLSNSTLEHLSELIELEPKRVRFIHGSILEPRALAEGVSGVSTVFHLAALGSVPRSIEDPARTWDVNATGTLRVLEAARAAKVERVIYSASSSAYGETTQLPQRETDPTRPVSPYAASKLAGEHLCRAWCESYQLSTMSLRYFNVFGPRQPADSAYAAVVAAFIRRVASGKAPVIFGDGEQSRDFTFVSNAVAANLLAAASKRDPKGEVVNIGTGDSVTINSLAARVIERLGANDLTPEHKPPRAGDVRHSQADLTRARELLDYRPITTFADGLAETIDWFDLASSRAGEGG
ncbi:MAG: NAD-dependent epimerase/dehydratase family protein [Phycisphaerales bacterium]